MGSVNAKQVLNNLYGLMMEINLHRSEEDILAELRANPDPQIDKHLLKIKQLSAKLKAQANKQRFERALEQFKMLKQKSLDEINKLFHSNEQEILIPLFRKFEDLSSEDEAAILQDQELLHLLDILKNRIDENPE